MGFVCILLTNILLTGCIVTIPGITTKEQEQLAKEDQVTLFAAQKMPTEPLSLHEAMARALKYNLDLRQKAMEETLANKQEKVSELDMLPRLVASAGYSSRSPEDASISKSILSGLISKEASVSSDPISKNTDLTLSWNWLDFGVSYFQARQDGNKALIQHEYRRKAAHNLMRDVRFAFWKATAAQSLEKEMLAIRQASEQALEEARTAEQEGLRAPVHSLQFQLGMLEIMRQIEKSLAELSLAKEELAVLIHLPPGTPYQLRDDSNTMVTSLGECATPETLEQMALSSRPELLIERYQARIEADETRKAIARLFPGLEFNLTKNYDSNSYLVNQHWAQAGARISWNLLRAVTGQSQQELSDERENVVRMRRLVAHMAVLSQTRIAYQEYRTAEEMLHRAIIENALRQRLQNHAADRSALGLESQLSYVHTAASFVLGRIQQYEAYARYQSALGHLYATLGLDPLQEGEEQKEINQLERHLRENEIRWQQMIFLPATPLPFSTRETTAPLPVDALLWDNVTQSSLSQVVAQVATPTVPDGTPQTLATPKPNRSPLPYVVQVMASADAAEIDAMVTHLKSRGYQPSINTIRHRNGNAMMQIWIGRHATMAEAQTIMQQYQEKEQKPVFIRRLTGYR